VPGRFLSKGGFLSCGSLPPMEIPRVTHWEAGGLPDDEAVLARMSAEGLRPHGWGNEPGDRYGWHNHEYHKVLYCVQGSITFHVLGADLLLRQGDRLDLPPGAPHAATVGPDGVRCLEAPAQLTDQEGQSRRRSSQR
jgi:quercetin dioxygenase-like cupin family protein